MSQTKPRPTVGATEHHYLAKPAAGEGPGVLALHAWWGPNDFFRAFCDRLAGEGYVVLAPDLYHGKIASTIEGAKKLRSGLKGDTVSQEILRAAGHLRATCAAAERRIGIVGFSLGGYWALWMAVESPTPVAATVAFYATRGGDYSQSRSTFQFHLAEHDDYVAASGVKKLQKSLKAAGREAEFHTYAGTTHWFVENDRPDAYNAQAAELSWARTVQFLKKHLG